MASRQALVVSDDRSDSQVISDVLGGLSVEVQPFSTPGEALGALRLRSAWVLVIGTEMPGAEMAELIGQAHRVRQPLVVVAIAARGADAAALVRAGAFDVLARPVDRAQVGLVMEKVVAHHRVLDEVRRLRAETGGDDGDHRLVGRSGVMERVRERVARLAAADVNVLITGERGVGKELAARVLHGLSARREGPFVVAPASEPLPALPGAAGGGTLFLDEVADLAPAAQGALLDALLRDHVGVRVIASTGADLPGRVQDGRFRDDLYHHLSAGTVALPPLRKRSDDVVHLVHHFIDAIRAINALPPVRLLPETLHVLECHRWPGNVDELRHAIEQAVIVANDDTIRIDDLPEAIRSAGDPGPSPVGAFAGRFREEKRRTVDAFERRYLRKLMDRHGGNVTAAATASGMLRSALQRLLRKHDLRSSAFRRDRLGSRQKPID